jgi:hypothetical protein
LEAARTTSAFGAGRAQVRALERIDRNVNSRQPRGDCRADGSESNFFADEQHRRLVTLAFPDDDRAIDWHVIQALPHGLDRGLIRFPPVAESHRVGARNRCLLHDAEEFE